jgi:hypothetical protein
MNEKALRVRYQKNKVKKGEMENV